MFKLTEILKATRGKLISATPNALLGDVSIDTRTLKKGGIFLAIKGDRFDGHNFISDAVQRGAGCVIASRFSFLSKSKKTALIKVVDTKKALGGIAACHRSKFDLPLIAVTGSNGKTTVKEMIAWVLSERFCVLKNEGTKNNQIGLPMALLNLNSAHRSAVLEIGTNHFGEVEYLARICRPNIGIITNIGPSHLEHFGSLKGVFREKYALVENLSDPRLVILNRDDAFLKSTLLGKRKQPFTVGFGFDSHSDFQASAVKYTGRGLEFIVNGKEKFFLNTHGRHNIYNVLAAVAVGRILGMPYRDIITRLACFNFPQGRLCLVAYNKVHFLDDSYNSNPLSLKEALRALADLPVRGRKIFVMGDMRELGEHEKDFHYQAAREALAICDTFITVGELSGAAAGAARSSLGRAKDIFCCRNAQEARKVLFKKVRPDSRDIVLVKGSRAMHMEEIFKSR